MQAGAQHINMLLSLMVLTPKRGKWTHHTNSLSTASDRYLTIQLHRVPKTVLCKGWDKGCSPQDSYSLVFFQSSTYAGEAFPISLDGRFPTDGCWCKHPEQIFLLLQLVGHWFGMVFWYILAHSGCPQTQRTICLLPNKKHQVGRRNTHVRKSMIG